MATVLEISNVDKMVTNVIRECKLTKKKKRSGDIHRVLNNEEARVDFMVTGICIQVTGC